MDAFEQQRSPNQITHRKDARSQLTKPETDGWSGATCNKRPNIEKNPMLSPLRDHPSQRAVCGCVKKFDVLPDPKSSASSIPPEPQNRPQTAMVEFPGLEPG
ncbi:hypothetical protein L6R29_06085 [Myxococcota bacterium]|nr:hypothetical protein [Myxococcota bacterium]